MFAGRSGCVFIDGAVRHLLPCFPVSLSGGILRAPLSDAPHVSRAAAVPPPSLRCRRIRFRRRCHHCASPRTASPFSVALRSAHSALCRRRRFCSLHVDRRGFFLRGRRRIVYSCILHHAFLRLRARALRSAVEPSPGCRAVAHPERPLLFKERQPGAPHS